MITNDGVVNVFGFDYNVPATRYVWRSQQGVWSLPVDLDDQYGSYMVARTDSLGRLYAMWITRTENELYYTRQELNGAWLPARSIFHFPVYPSRPELGVDPGGKIHMIWPDSNTYNVLYYFGPEIASQDYVSRLSQSLLVPVSMTAPMLSYLYHLEGVTEDSNGSFNVQISDGDNPTTIYSSAENTEDWSHQWHDLTPWIGQAVTLTFSLDGAAGYPYAWADLDEVTLGSANPDAWVTGLRTAGLPGEQASFSIGYGNRGYTLGSSGIITVTLPASLTFVSASIDPLTSSITATNVITWDLGDLPAGSGPSYLVITVTLAADLPLGISLEIPVAIAPAAGELELVNNTSQVVLFIGRQVFLPVMVR